MPTAASGTKDVNIHFVISAPRSGSTWLSSALNLHPDIFATEHRWFGEFAEVWPNNDGSNSARITLDAYVQGMAVHYFFSQLGFDRRSFIERFQREFFEFLLNFARHYSGKPVVVDKITPYRGTSEMVVRKIHQFFPRARIVHLIRDGRDVVTSGTFDWIQREPAPTDRHALFVQQRRDTHLKRFFDDQTIEQWCRTWTEPIAAIADNGSSTIEVRYESMLQDQAAELVRILEYLGLRPDLPIARRCAESVTFQRVTGRPAGAADHLAKARRGVAGDWKNYFTRADGELFDRLAGDWLQTLGYEKDRTWIDRLPEQLDLRLETVHSGV